jgi:hypothetical protein
MLVSGYHSLGMRLWENDGMHLGQLFPRSLSKISRNDDLLQEKDSVPSHFLRRSRPARCQSQPLSEQFQTSAKKAQMEIGTFNNISFSSSTSEVAFHNSISTPLSSSKQLVYPLLR